MVKNADTTFTPDSIVALISNFNQTPENYFLSSSTPIEGVIPFIDSDITNFQEDVLDPLNSKLSFKLELVPTPTLPSFQTIKFIFDLKTTHTPEVLIVESPTSSLEPLKSEVFSMDFRTLLPIGTEAVTVEERALEIAWIRKFVEKSFFKYISNDIGKAFKAKTATEASSLILDKAGFDAIFEEIVAFPSVSVTGWSYEVVAEPSVEPNSITINFTLSNPLFTDLTPEETKSFFEIQGFAKV